MMSKKRKEFLVSLVAGLIICILVICINWEADYPLTQRLSDGFFVSAILLLGGGGLKFARNFGMFDIFGFSAKSLVKIHWPWAAPVTPQDEKESYADYKERKQKERKSSAPILWAGLVYLVLACILLVGYFVIA